MTPLATRFELRLDEDTVRRIDEWAIAQHDQPSRAESMRRLVEKGLAADASQTARHLCVSGADALMMHMLVALLKVQKIKNPDIDPQLVEAALVGGHTWALEWTYPGIFHDHIDSRETLKEVLDVLDMWDFLELSYEKFSAKQKEYVKREAEPFGTHVKFRGFDGNNETDEMGIARFLVEEMNRFARFQGRDFNSHMPSVDAYRRMLSVFLPMRKKLAGRGLTEVELAEILSAMAHPDYRKRKK